MADEDYGIEISKGPGASSVGTHGFITKVWAMVNAPHERLIKWSRNGTTVLVVDQKKFAQTVLPKYFKHNKMESFVRQMNIYGFKKVFKVTDGTLMTPESQKIEFENRFFVKERFDLTKNIERRDSKKPKKENQEDMRAMIDHIQQKQDKTEMDIQSLSELNEHLSQEVSDLQRRHDKQADGMNVIFGSVLNYIQRSIPAERKRKLPRGEMTVAEFLADRPKTNRRNAPADLPSLLDQIQRQMLSSNPSVQYETDEEDLPPTDQFFQSYQSESSLFEPTDVIQNQVANNQPASSNMFIEQPQRVEFEGLELDELFSS